jgi:hypothetical protein
MSVHKIRESIDALADEIAKRVSDEGLRKAENVGALAQLPPGHDFGREVVKRHAVETITDWLLGDLEGFPA